jgi:hypothetical protein
MAARRVSSEPRKCQVEGCGKEYLANGYCRRHYDQVRNSGKIMERTIYDPNPVTSDGDTAVMDMYDKHGNYTCSTIMDASDVDLVKDRKWFRIKAGYVTHFDPKTRKSLYLHRVILGAETGKDVDHVDGNPLNNRKSNLRVCTHAQNGQNQKLSSKNTSGVKNVSWDSARDRWSVEVVEQGVKHRLGRFKNLEDAKRAAEIAREKYHGEFCNHG